MTTTTPTETRIVTIASIQADIEALRASRQLGNEAARLASVALTLEGDDAILANRLVVQGSDPFSLELASTGQVSDYIRRAHFEGPGFLTGKEKDHWLLLASASSDETNAADLPVHAKVDQFLKAVACIQEISTDEARMWVASTSMEAKIRALPYTEEFVDGVPTRVYTGDLGFAAAYWSGQEHAAVRDPQGVLFVGSNGRPLTEIGITVGKVLSPTFGIVFPKA